MFVCITNTNKKTTTTRLEPLTNWATIEDSTTRLPDHEHSLKLSPYNLPWFHIYYTCCGCHHSYTKFAHSRYLKKLLYIPKHSAAPSCSSKRAKIINILWRNTPGASLLIRSRDEFLTPLSCTLRLQPFSSSPSPPNANPPPWEKPLKCQYFIFLVL